MQLGTGSDSHDLPIGLIGVGLLGLAIAKRLMDAGLDVVGFDIRNERLELLQQAGGRVAGSATEVFSSSRRTVLSLLDSEQVGDVLSNIEFSPDTVLFDTTTGRPEDATEWARFLESQSGCYLDTTVVGSSEQLRHGQATILVGASKKQFTQHKLLLNAIAPRLFHTGPVGSAAKTKLVMNLCIGLHRAVLAEALTLAKAFDLPLQQTLDILQATPAASMAMETKGAKMLTGDFVPQAKLVQHFKDVRLILDEAKDRAVGLPLSDVHASLLAKLVDAGFGELDNSAIIKAFESNRK